MITVVLQQQDGAELDRCAVSEVTLFALLGAIDERPLSSVTISKAACPLSATPSHQDELGPVI